MKPQIFSSQKDRIYFYEILKARYTASARNQAEYEAAALRAAREAGV